MNSLSGLELNQQLFFNLKIMLKLAVEMDFGDCFDDGSHTVHGPVIRNELKIKQLHLSLNQMNLIVYNFLESLGGFEAYQIFEEMYNDQKNNRVLWNTQGCCVFTQLRLSFGAIKNGKIPRNIFYSIFWCGF